MDELVSIGRVKRDISELVNRVAFGGERIVLTSRGKPKAALVSIDDYERLLHKLEENRQARMEAWLAQAQDLSEEILRRRDGLPIDVDILLEQDWDELEDRSD